LHGDAHVPESWMLARLNRETQHHHLLADNDRLAMLGSAPDREGYTSFLARVYGFEAPVEAALRRTEHLHEWIDLRDRAHPRLLRADLQALGVADPNQLPRCSMVLPFRHPAEALGWAYAVERNTLLHGVIERHLRGRMPGVLERAGSYLIGRQRSNALRFRDLGAALDRMAKDAACAERIVDGARAAFRAQHGWYDVALPPRVRVA
jgi:heme oxygenase